MNLIDVMRDMIENKSIYRINDYKYCITYSQRYNCFLWCNEEGRAIEEFLEMSCPYKRVILSPKLLGTYTKII